MWFIIISLIGTIICLWIIKHTINVAIEDFEMNEKMFPGITIGRLNKDMNTILTRENRIIIKRQFDCGCYDYPKNPVYYFVEGQNMTYRFVLSELSKQGLETNCKHMFVDDFKQNTNIQYSLCLGK